MKVVIVAFAFLALVAAVPVEYKEPVKLLRSENDQQPGKGYSFGFESEDGIQRQEIGEVKEVLDEENKSHSVVVVRGSFTYIDKEGNPVSVTYEADQDGFRAFGDSIPKPVSRR